MREQRKVVTVLFADVVGSTSLASEADPEVVRAQMSRYFERVTAIAKAHGGTVEKFAGDAAMIVFGVPATHDDDAERAVRAAIQVRNGASELAVRVGVNTGEAVTEAREDRQYMVTGDAVNIAARLQQGADPGEVVVGVLTERLTRSVIEYSPREPVTAKGKSLPLVAFRALRSRTDVPSQARGVPGLHSPLVGRDRELRLLRDTYARVAAETHLHLFTLIGAPGVGKSRLLDEALSEIARAGGRVLRGRCLPYGSGITYWPLIEMVRQDTEIRLGDDRALALAKLDRWLGEIMPGESERPAIRARLSVMMGFEQPEVVMPDTPPERVKLEVAWAVRRYVQAISGSGPVVIVIDDVQWAEPALLEIIEQVADRLSATSAMLIVIARPEFLEQHPGWGSGKANTSTISLDPLTAAETGLLVSNLLTVDALPAGVRTQIVDQSAGTPLFCEELIRMLVDDGRLTRDGDRWRTVPELEHIPVPPSVNAVVSARLDGLPEGDRAVLQAASVVGERFTASQVTALFGGAEVDGYLESLRRKGLIGGDDRRDSEMWFSHLLVRDAAYGSLTKAERASLHDRFGAVLEAQVHDAEQVSEILAYHAATAFSLTAELSLGGEVMHGRAHRALRWSLQLAERAGSRYDRLVLESALAIARAAAEQLSDGGGQETQARLSLVEAQRAVIVADYRAAGLHAAEAAAIAESAGLDALVARARLSEAWISTWAGTGSVGEFEGAVQRAIDACRKAGDREGSIEARLIGAETSWALGKLDDFITTLDQLAVEARSIGDRRHLARILMRAAIGERVRGNGAAAKRAAAEGAQIAADIGLRDLMLRLQFMRADDAWEAGDVVRGEAMMRQFLADATEAGAGQLILLGLRFLGSLLVTDKRYADAVPVIDEGIELSHSTGDRWNRAELYALGAEAALGLGDIGGAGRFADEALEFVRSEDDLSAVAVVYRVLGMIRSAEGHAVEAELALRKAYETAQSTDYHPDRIETGLALASFLVRTDRQDEGRLLLDEARRLCRHADWHLWDAEIRQIDSVLEVGT